MNTILVIHGMVFPFPSSQYISKLGVLRPCQSRKLCLTAGIRDTTIYYDANKEMKGQERIGDHELGGCLFHVPLHQ